ETLLSCRVPSPDITTMSVNVPPISTATLIDDSINVSRGRGRRKGLRETTLPRRPTSGNIIYGLSCRGSPSNLASNLASNLIKSVESSHVRFAAAENPNGDVKVDLNCYAAFATQQQLSPRWSAMTLRPIMLLATRAQSTGPDMSRSAIINSLE